MHFYYICSNKFLLSSKGNSTKT